MDRSAGVGRVRQHAARAALPVLTRQSQVTAALAERAQSSRGTPTRRADDKDIDDDEQSLSGREDEDDTDDDEPEPVAP